MVSFVTFYLIVYCLLLQFEQTRDYAVLMFLFSPFLLGWMIYVMLKYGNHNGSELGNQEFGYQDKRPEELGVF